MASDESFVQFVVDQLKRTAAVERKKMFGESAIYLDGKVVALVCDDRVFVKPTDAGRALIGAPEEAPPFPGAKSWFVVGDRLDDADWIGALARVTADALPVPKPKAVRKPGVAAPSASAPRRR